MQEVPAMVKHTPPMGWNSWNTFGTNISDQLIRETADEMVETGLLSAGYNYLVIDDCWAELNRDENGCMVPSKKKFPNGIKVVSDYVHSKGLKFGMYSCAGNMTCDSYPGSFEHEFIDATSFAQWGVDFLKYDYCFKPIHQQGDLLYKRMGAALANCGRDILFSACSWGADDTRSWAKSTGAHMWRSTYDIKDNWSSIKQIAQEQPANQPYNGIGCFNDMDMLVVGMNGSGNVGLGGCTVEEYRTHFSMWALLNSPLMIGCDIRNMTSETKEILTHKEMIAINQDPAGRQPYLASNNADTPIWIKLLDDGDLVIGFFNLSDTDCPTICHWADFGIDRASGKALSLHDLWTGEELGIFNDLYHSTVKAHACRMLRVRLVNAK
jgi:alpha-galactosidase